MIEPTGLTATDIAILRALEEAGAGPSGDHVSSGVVIKALSPMLRLRNAYLLGADLARRDLLQLPLIDGRGHLGHRGQGPSSPGSTAMRLTEVGALALRAERGDAAPIPLQLINGDWWTGGVRPSHDPRRVIDAISALLHDPGLDDRELGRMIGPPRFPVGCQVTGEIAKLVEGEAVELRLVAVATVVDDPEPGVLITNIPPFEHPAGVAELLRAYLGTGSRQVGVQRPIGAPAGKDVPLLRDIVDLSDEDGERLLVRPEPSITPEYVIDRIMEIYGPSIAVTASYGEPLADMTRDWVGGADDGTGKLGETLAELASMVPDPTPAATRSGHS